MSILLAWRAVIGIIIISILGGSMGLSISEIRKNTTRARHLMQRTRAQRFAVGAFNIDNQETLIAVARARKNLHHRVGEVFRRRSEGYGSRERS